MAGHRTWQDVYQSAIDSGADDASALALDFLRRDSAPRASITGVSITDETDSWAQAAERPERKMDVIIGLDWVKVWVYGKHASPEQQCLQLDQLKTAAKERTMDRFFERSGQL